ncbi:MAG: MBL fold metallo-hydrolase [Kofleriaceae bacterium]
MTEIWFHVWGCRGGRNVHGSRIGQLTSCYSLRAGADLYVLDGGRGLGALAEAVLRGIAELRGVERVHVLVTHAHVDHWEGLRDAAWLWTTNNGLAVTVLGPGEAIDAIRRGYEPPSFVPLDVLAQGMLATFAYREVAANASITLPGATLATVELHHYSGIAPAARHLDTLGFHLTVDGGGPRIAYLCDHEPIAATRMLEDTLLAKSDLALVDANYGELSEHAFGHGSLAYAAELAGRHPGTAIVATHHGPMRTDDAIEASFARHGVAHPNLSMARDGLRARWDGTRFVVVS